MAHGPFGAPDVHEQRKPWVPLMMEASYKPSGWLGIMCVGTACSCRFLRVPLMCGVSSRGRGARRLGSRLYYEFTATALGDDSAWERLADSVAVEVRRHGAPPAVSPAPTVATAREAEAAVRDPVGEVAPAAPVPRLAPAALSTAPMREATEAGVGVSSVVHMGNRNSTQMVNNNTNSSTNSNNTNSNVGNTTASTIVFL